jgi:hypothetical protein
MLVAVIRLRLLVLFRPVETPLAALRAACSASLATTTTTALRPPFARPASLTRITPTATATAAAARAFLSNTSVRGMLAGTRGARRIAFGGLRTGGGRF